MGGVGGGSHPPMGFKGEWPPPKAFEQYTLSRGWKKYKRKEAENQIKEGKFLKVLQSMLGFYKEYHPLGLTLWEIPSPRPHSLRNTLLPLLPCSHVYKVATEGGDILNVPILWHGLGGAEFFGLSQRLGGSPRGVSGDAGEVSSILIKLSMKNYNLGHFL